MSDVTVDAASVYKKNSNWWRFHHNFLILKLPQMAPRIITLFEQFNVSRLIPIRVTQGHWPEDQQK